MTPKRCCSSTIASPSCRQPHAGVQQRLRPDEQRDAPGGRALEQRRTRRARRGAGQERDLHPEARRRRLQRAQLLLREHLGRHAPSGSARPRLRPAPPRQRALAGFAATDVAHQQALHRHGRASIIGDVVSARCCEVVSAIAAPPPRARARRPPPPASPTAPPRRRRRRGRKAICVTEQRLERDAPACLRQRRVGRHCSGLPGACEPVERLGQRRRRSRCRARRRGSSPPSRRQRASVDVRIDASVVVDALDVGIAGRNPSTPVRGGRARRCHVRRMHHLARAVAAVRSGRANATGSPS